MPAFQLDLCELVIRKYGYIPCDTNSDAKSKQSACAVYYQDSLQLGHHNNVAPDMLIDALYLCFHPYEAHRMCSYITTYHTHKYSVITYICSYKAHKST